MTAGVRDGDILAGKYRVERVLGSGGMGVVVAAYHLQLHQRVAIKFLLPEALSNSEAVERFAREARAAVKITSEHVARVIDVGTLETGAPFMVMEFLEGHDLAQWVRLRGSLPLEQAVDFALQACEALAEAHTLGIVHRDMSPYGLAVYGGVVYWTDILAGTVMSCAIGGCSNAPTTIAKNQNNPHGIAVNATGSTG